MALEARPNQACVRKPGINRLQVLSKRRWYFLCREIIFLELDNKCSWMSKAQHLMWKDWEERWPTHFLIINQPSNLELFFKTQSFFPSRWCGILPHPENNTMAHNLLWLKVTSKGQGERTCLNHMINVRYAEDFCQPFSWFYSPEIPNSKFTEAAPAQKQCALTSEGEIPKSAMSAWVTLMNWNLERQDL